MLNAFWWYEAACILCASLEATRPFVQIKENANYRYRLRY